MLKKFISIILMLAMIFSVSTVSSFASNSERSLDMEEAVAVQLKSLNLFKGVSETNFDLGRAPSRVEALVIMLRLLGKESEILAGSYSHPFKDVPTWAAKYVGYAYENGLTKGVSKTQFGSGDTASSAQFVTFVLRAMDYSDTNGDFTWSNPFTLATELGIIDDSIVIDGGFLRADCGSVCFNALSAKLKGGTKTLSEKLISEKVFTKEAYDASVKVIKTLKTSQPVLVSSASQVEIMGLPKGYSYIENADSCEDFIHNVLYAAASGNYTFAYQGTIQHGSINMDWVRSVMPELYGAYVNQWYFGVVNVDGKYQLRLQGQEGVSKTELGTQNAAAIAAAKNIYKKLHANGTVSEGMTQKQIAKAYSDYLYSLNIPEGRGIDMGVNKPETMKFDTAYAVLVANKGDCTGRAAAFNMLMHLEGIACTGVRAHVDAKHGDSDHVLNYMILDGQEYYNDWHEPDFSFVKIAEASGKGLSVYEDYLYSAKLIAKAYSGSVAAFDKAARQAFEDVMRDGKYTGKYFTDSKNVSYQCTGNATVEYIGDGQFKLTPTSGKIVYDEKQSYFFALKISGAPGNSWEGSDVSGGRIRFENGSVIINVANSESINLGKSVSPDVDVTDYFLKKAIEVSFTQGSTTWKATGTPQ